MADRLLRDRLLWLDDDEAGTRLTQPPVMTAVSPSTLKRFWYIGPPSSAARTIWARHPGVRQARKLLADVISIGVGPKH
jgi:hypothetical protein